MSPVYLRDLGFQRNQPEDREGLCRTRRPGRGHLVNSGGWQDTDGNHTHSAINFPIQQEPQTRGLERYASSSSAPPIPQRFISMEHGKQEVQPGIPLAEPGVSFQKISLKEIYFKDLMVITKGWNPTRQLRLLELRENRIRENQATIQAIEEQLTQTGHTKIPSGSQGAGQISSPVASYHSETNRSVTRVTILHNPRTFQEKTRIQAQKQDHLQPKEERFGPKDPEAVGFG
ncbi:hypothetical protein O181_120695 [Austropuccinia psidii MF-1]|uniref:Uncharacterized protein n=1 Tax=Austropuccinia psidii MF-1 TaxID=1389203 RepID=A0A9Q3KG92_9BASI|nr:hypothetical protein [Austropuccinia psidii MF-1]